MPIRLLSQRSSHLQPIIIVALGTGMRLGEILNLEWSHVDFSSRTIKVEKGESGRARSISMEWGGVVDALKGVQSQPIGSKYVFPDRNGVPMGSFKTAFIKARGWPVSAPSAASTTFDIPSAVGAPN